MNKLRMCKSAETVCVKCKQTVINYVKCINCGFYLGYAKNYKNYKGNYNKEVECCIKSGKTDKGKLITISISSLKNVIVKGMAKALRPLIDEIENVKHEIITLKLEAKKINENKIPLNSTMHSYANAVKEKLVIKPKNKNQNNGHAKTDLKQSLCAKKTKCNSK